MKTTRPAKPDTHASGYTPAEQAQIAADEAVANAARAAKLAAWILGCEIDDAEGEAY